MAGWPSTWTRPDVPSLTYQELGDRLGVNAEAARAIARRRRWPITRGNDGKARISVDEAELAAENVRAPPATSSLDGLATIRPDDQADAGLLRELRERLAAVEGERDRLVSELAEARERAIRTEAEAQATRTIAAVEVEAVRKATEDRVAARNAAIEVLQAARDDLATRLDRAEAELRDARRPWWRRMLGR
jgi:chromosome segregation ATPase